MKHAIRHRLLALIWVSLLLLFSNGRADAAPSRAEYGDFAAKLDAGMSALLAKYQVPGAVVASIQNGEVAWTRPYGVANVATRAPMRADMVFEHGSNGKMLTAWAVMHLVEQDKLELDAPVNNYLKRWKIQSSEFSASAVTIRQLLSHTAGLSIHGFLDYSSRRSTIPTLVEALDGNHPLEGLVELLETGRPSLGQVMLVQTPGSAYKYSGGGYAVLQLVVEDVTGEPFDDYFQREIAAPLGVPNFQWAWTPELTSLAPVPYTNDQRAHEYRQLAAHAIGSEIATVSDFARLLAASVEGPNGEPIGRGILKSETVIEMMSAQPATNGTYGLGYGVGSLNGNPSVSHSGANPGWTAFYILDRVNREGFVIASNSTRGGALHLAVLNEWLDAVYGSGRRTEIAPDPPLDASAVLALALGIFFGAMWLVSLTWFVLQLRSGQRKRAAHPTLPGWIPALLWFSAMLFIWYWLYAPLPVYLPSWVPDLWATPSTDGLILILALWVGLSGAHALYPKHQ